MKLGNIVSDYEISEGNLFNIVKNYDDINDELPTLIVGWKEMNKLFPNHSILNEKINHNLYWTLSKFEDRNEFNINLERFIQNSYNKRFSNFTFYYIDLINISFKKLKRIVTKIKSSDNIISYSNDNDIIIFCDNIIFSININTLLFLDIDIDKLKTKIIKISNSVLPNKKSSDIWKLHSDRLYNDESLIPALYSLMNN